MTVFLTFFAPTYILHAKYICRNPRCKSVKLIKVFSNTNFSEYIICASFNIFFETCSLCGGIQFVINYCFLKAVKIGGVVNESVLKPTANKVTKIVHLNNLMALHV
jgi:hypothetical protein